jgi:cholinesterase
MKQLFAAIVGLAVLLSGATVGAAPFSQVIVFGDSNVDNGNLRALFGPAVNPPPNFGGRNNNGPVVVEYLAQALGVPLQDYAYSGATTGAPGLNPLIPSTLTQIQTYFATLGGGMADPHALYVYWAGSNDILLATTPPAALPTKISGAVGNVDTALRQLDAAGAHHTVVANRTPRPNMASVDNQNGIALNAALGALVQSIDLQLAAHIHLYDAYSAIEHMVLNPSGYGFIQTTALCLPNNPGPDNCANDLAVAAGYINWDAAHKTTRVHELMAQQLLLHVPEPQALALLLLALVAVALTTRRRVRWLASPEAVTH